MASITLPSSVSSIGNSAFNGSGVEHIVIPGAVTALGESVFQASKLKSFVAEEGLVTLGSNTLFYNATSLVFVDLPSTVSSIARNTFNGCRALTTIICRATTPPTVGASAFYGVPSACSIYVPDSAVAAYKAASEWSSRASYIKPLSQYGG